MMQNRARMARAFPIIVAILLVIGCGWLYRAPILRSAADLWIVSDSIEDADAVVVLGGGLETRPFAAANLYAAGKVKLVLLSSVNIPNHTELNRAILIKSGVSPQAIVIVGHNLSSTYEEMRAVREWAQRNGTKKIIIVTEMFPSRRVRWIFTRGLAAIGVKVMLHPIPSPRYDSKRWWQYRWSITEFHEEVLKYLYYRLMY